MCACVHVFFSMCSCACTSTCGEKTPVAQYDGENGKGKKAVKKQWQSVAWRTLDPQSTALIGYLPKRFFNWSSASCHHSVITSRRSWGHFNTICTKTNTHSYSDRTGLKSSEIINTLCSTSIKLQSSQC